jgi:hypothetical protein
MSTPKAYATLILLAIMVSHGALRAFHIDNPGSKAVQAKTNLPVHKFFHDELFYAQGYTIETDPLYLLQAAKDTLAYLQARQKNRSSITNPSTFIDLLSYAKVIETLKFIVTTTEQDKKTGVFRLTNPTFLQKNFSCIAWHADRNGAQKNGIKLTNNNIRLTSYAIFSVKGNRRKTADYPCALYALKSSKTKTQFTKQQILAGTLEKGANRNNYKALAWVSRQSLEDALIHGTVLVNFSGGESKIFQVNKHNNIAYNKQNKNMLTQKRYWFFKELKGSSRLQGNLIDRFKRRKQVIFAGDINHIGIGKVIAIAHRNPLTNKKEMRLGILADTGGAFTNNLYQLDLFAGIINGHAQYHHYLRHLPPTTKACVLYKI